MRKVIIVIVTAAAALLGLSPAVASTSATWTVEPGGGFYTFTNSNDSFLRDTTTGAAFPCVSAFDISGEFKSGSGLSNPIGTVKTARGGNTIGVVLCSGNGLNIALSFKNLPWSIRVVRYDSAGVGATSGVLLGIAGNVASQSSVPCSAAIDGTAPGAGNGRVGFRYLNNGDFFIKATGNLHFDNVSGCNGHINNGDSMTYTPSLLIKADGSHDVNVITSP
jgi:hypothetical protein